MITKNLREALLHSLNPNRPQLVCGRGDTAVIDAAALHRVWQLGAGTLSPTQFDHLQTLLELISLRMRTADYGKTVDAALKGANHG